jgi:hypothetical protein
LLWRGATKASFADFATLQLTTPERPSPFLELVLLAPTEASVQTSKDLNLLAQIESIEKLDVNPVKQKLPSESIESFEISK